MKLRTPSGPQRIICLTEETTETLYLLGEQHRIVGISGFTVRPPQARKEKPKVSGFTSANINKILPLKPDLVLEFSDLQADIAAQLIREGIAVHIFNQRSVPEIFEMIHLLGTLVGAQEKTQTLVEKLRHILLTIEQSASQLQRRPKIYFEEWNDPLISCIRWVSELITIAGGDDCFSDLAQAPSAKNRIITDDAEIIRRQPDIIIGSWCGKHFRPEQVSARPGWNEIPAVRNNHLYEIKSCDILQPGPAALMDGAQQIHNIIEQWSKKQS